MRTMTDYNDMAYWFPIIAAEGLPVPSTILIEHSCDLTCLLDGQVPDGWEDLCDALRDAGDDGLGWPMFLRTGHTAGKHQWARTCRVPSAHDIPAHVAALVEESALAGIVGLPTTAWAAREMLNVEPLFHCQRWEGLPITREFRLFVRDGNVEHIQPYWPCAAVKTGDPDIQSWRAALAKAAHLKVAERERIVSIAERAGIAAAGPGYWSVDVLQDRGHRWWITDMAEGDASFRYTP